MNTTSTFNRSWSRVILNALLRYGVKHFCLAPGSRSTPLTLEALHLQQKYLAQCHTHFDERGLGFFALGIAKATNDPVAIIVTSGTAVANLYPAVIEASLTHHKLIILSADRPEELIGCGANQAIYQENIFANYPVDRLNLPKPSRSYRANWLVSVVEKICNTQQNKAGVVHINIPFEEPLYNAEEAKIELDEWLLPLQSWFIKSTHKWLREQTNQQDVITHPDWDEWRLKRGIIIVGKLPLGQSSSLKSWAETLGWVLITDIQSTVESDTPYADIWLANKTVQERLLNADIVIQFGSQLVSKRVNEFLAKFNGEYWVVDPYTDYLNQNAKPQTRFVAKVNHFVRSHPALRQKSWLLEPLALSQFCTKFIKDQVESSLSEVSLAYNIDQILPKNGHLFIGNSLFVRLVDAFGRLPEGYPVYTNRGASGIDGLIATMSGVSKSTEQATVGIVGDISALHDLNSIALLRQIHHPTLLFVINNGGGAIFDMLPVEPSAKRDYYRATHNFEFSHIATMFGLDYVRPFTWADLKTKLTKAYSRKGVTLVEIKVNDQEGSALYQSIVKQISQAVID